MRNIDEHNITGAVIARFDNCADPRLKEILSSLVRHLHDFVRETRLTEAEWMQGIEFLTATGHKSDAKRQEFILLSDTLGVSMLTVAQNHSLVAGATEATVFGPFHVETAPQFANGADIAADAPGEPLFVDCTIRGSDGAPVPAPRSMSGRPTRKASTTSSTRTSTTTAPAACCTAMAKAGCAFAASCRSPIRCPPTVRSAACWWRAAAIRGGRRMCTSGSRHRATRR